MVWNMLKEAATYNRLLSVVLQAFTPTRVLGVNPNRKSVRLFTEWPGAAANGHMQLYVSPDMPVLQSQGPTAPFIQTNLTGVLGNAFNLISNVGLNGYFHSYELRHTGEVWLYLLTDNLLTAQQISTNHCVNLVEKCYA